MAKINQPPPGAPQWPWGAPRTVRERLLDPAQLDRKKQLRKKGDPKNPSLASAALMDSIGPAHSADELRLPFPPMPGGHDGDLEAFREREHLGTAADRDGAEQRALLERGLAAIKIPPDRMERLKGLLAREAGMLKVVKQLKEEVDEIERLRRQSQDEKGY